MRIIAGSAKGTKLKMVPGKHVRPTVDRVKETLFNVIGPYFDEGWALDLFAGTGGLGLEALSRGIAHAVFIDQSRTSIETIKENIQLTHFEKQSEWYRQDARAAIKFLAKRAVKFNLIFLDPPYHENWLEPIVYQILQLDLLEDRGVLVLEHPTRVKIPESWSGLSSDRILTFGDTQLTILTK
ncbi:16S rRNA (guanine(966)-N(2))-methyltransferase RsmD [Hazenella sp. IB182353]|uniref:16S rRNA (guanine(966)-N(2))-methyltransferase RsmD n=1 Tax=Polycladospora coralii TaxID=2771432 RepID=UPI001746B6B6|nr:16S rRNA (guanine(966)-N(2))-methyltransferase RsmD [Polycladospora coralii]MBS7530367.1 16S rRNA (guanine(966)-N(2))-methyltransferase RsmD [Polycladospora coralii]